MASKIFLISIIYFVLINFSQTLPVNDTKITPEIFKSNNSKEISMSSKPTKIQSVADIPILSRSTTLLPSSLKEDNSKITPNEKQKNAKDIESLNKTSELNVKKNIVNEIQKNEQLNTSQKVSQVPAKVSLNSSSDKDEEKSKSYQDETNIKLKHNYTIKKEESDNSKLNKSKPLNELKKDEPKSQLVDSTVKDEKSNTKNKEVPTSSIKDKDNDQLSPANDDSTYKLDDEEESKEKPFNKPDFANYSSDKNKAQLYDNTYGEDDENDNLRENISTNKHNKKVETPNKKFNPIKTSEMYDDANSHFFAYLLTVMVMAVLFYLLFHNKQRIIALMIEGRGARPSRRGGARAKYHKLDNNLEEAMSSIRGGGVSSSTSASGGLSNVY